LSNLDITVINDRAKLNKMSLERLSELNNDEKLDLHSICGTAC